MTKYALFFDIDGTLVSFQTHEIPPSTILALTQAKANGHKVFIATGRPPIIITNLGAIEHLIDGYVTTNGALCFVGNDVVSCKSIPQEEARLVVKDAQEKQYGVIVIGEKDVAIFDPKGEVDYIFGQQFKDYERELMSRLPGCTSGRWHPAFTDITAKGADKGEGLLAMASHQGLNPQQTMAFGDGGNDSSMVRGAGIGVAMGNAIDELKEIADYVTTSVDDDGIRNALRHFGLI